jgi:hypothetical protein
MQGFGGNGDERAEIALRVNRVRGLQELLDVRFCLDLVGVPQAYPGPRYQARSREQTASGACGRA